MITNRQFGVLSVVVAAVVVLNVVLSSGGSKHVDVDSSKQQIEKIDTPQAPKNTGYRQSSSPSSVATSKCDCEQRRVELLERSIKSIVAIYTTVERQINQVNPYDFFNTPFGDFFGFGGFGGGRRGEKGAPQKQKVVGFGSGVIIDSNDVDTLVITNHHVIKDNSKVEVLYNNRKYEAKVIGSDSIVDLALLKIEEKNLPSLQFGDSDALRIGTTVYSLGNPNGYNNTATSGIVTSNIHRGFNDDVSSKLVAIQTDAMMSNGSSGGALIDSNGDLVGINVAMAVQNGQGLTNMTFAIPVNVAKKAVLDFRKYGYIQRVVLGITATSVSDELVKEKKLKTYHGCYIDSIGKDSALKTTGIKAGDVIVAVVMEYNDPVNGVMQNIVEINDMARLQELLSTINPGSYVTIRVNRNGKEIDFKVKLGKESSMKIVESGNDLIVNGATIKNLNDKQRKVLADNDIHGGVIVSKKDKECKAWSQVKEGFVVTSVDNIDVTSCNDFKEQIKGKRNVLISGVYLNEPKQEYAYALNLM